MNPSTRHCPGSNQLLPLRLALTLLLLLCSNQFLVPCESLIVVAAVGNHTPASTPTTTKAFGSNHQPHRLSPQTSRFASKSLHQKQPTSSSSSSSSRLASMANGQSAAASFDEIKAASNIPNWVFRLNAATKWLVSVAVTVGVWVNPKRFQGPYIIVGSLVANYLSEVLKTVIHQERPYGAPFVDPGMPSTHAMVSFFVAMAWRETILMAAAPKHHGATTWLLGGAATMVSFLRVWCGYHTLPQITVGGLLGTGLASAWMVLGVALDRQNPKTLFAVSWATYLVGSAIYIQKRALRWLGEEKNL